MSTTAKRIRANNALVDPAKVYTLGDGVQVLKHAQHTGATPGRFVRGPGWSGPRQ